MLTLRLNALESAFPIVAAAGVAFAPDAADACPGYYDPCYSGEGWSDLNPVNAASIPADGVLVLQGTYVGAVQTDSFPSIAIEVTKDGQPVAGALEETATAGVLVWRPTDPWVPGPHVLGGTITNFGPVDGCIPPTLPLSGDLNVDPAPGVLPGPTPFEGTTQVTVTPEVELDTLVCCEGAPLPTQGYGYCGADYYINFDATQCAPLVGTGYFSLEVKGTPVADGPIAGQILYTVKLGDTVSGHSFLPEFSFGNLAGPTCAVIDATDLGSGTVVPGVEQCFGDDFADQLGPQTLHPEDTLSCPLQSCDASMDGKTWDPSKCTPYGGNPDGSSGDNPTDGGASDASDASDTGETTPEQDGDKGCACTSAPATTPPALLALAALALRRRRRA